MNALYGRDRTIQLLQPIEQKSRTCKQPTFHVLQITCLREIEAALEKYPFAKTAHWLDILETEEERASCCLTQLKEDIQRMKA